MSPPLNFTDEYIESFLRLRKIANNNEFRPPSREVTTITQLVAGVIVTEEGLPMY